MPPFLTLTGPTSYFTLEQWADKANNGLYQPPDEQMIEGAGKVEYLAHVPGGMVKVKLKDGREVIIHPRCTEELA